MLLEEEKPSIVSAKNMHKFAVELGAAIKIRFAIPSDRNSQAVAEMKDVWADMYSGANQLYPDQYVVEMKYNTDGKVTRTVDVYGEQWYAGKNRESTKKTFPYPYTVKEVIALKKALAINYPPYMIEGTPNGTDAIINSWGDDPTTGGKAPWIKDPLTFVTEDALRDMGVEVTPNSSLTAQELALKNAKLSAAWMEGLKGDDNVPLDMFMSQDTTGNGNNPIVAFSDLLNKSKAGPFHKTTDKKDNSIVYSNLVHGQASRKTYMYGGESGDLIKFSYNSTAKDKPIDAENDIDNIMIDPATGNLKVRNYSSMRISDAINQKTYDKLVARSSYGAAAAYLFKQYQGVFNPLLVQGDEEFTKNFTQSLAGKIHNIQGSIDESTLRTPNAFTPTVKGGPLSTNSQITLNNADVTLNEYQPGNQPGPTNTLLMTKTKKFKFGVEQAEDFSKVLEEATDEVIAQEMQSDKKLTKVTITVIGDPHAWNGATVKCDGLAKEDNRDYYIVEAEHTISTNGYMTVLTGHIPSEIQPVQVKKVVVPRKVAHKPIKKKPKITKVKDCPSCNLRNQS